MNESDSQTRVKILDDEKRKYTEKYQPVCVTPKAVSFSSPQTMKMASGVCGLLAAVLLSLPSSLSQFIPLIITAAHEQGKLDLKKCGSTVSPSELLIGTTIWRNKHRDPNTLIQLTFRQNRFTHQGLLLFIPRQFFFFFWFA